MVPVASIDEMMKTMTPELGKQGMDQWKAWMDAHKDVFVDMGAPVGRNKRVTSSGVEEVRNEVTGYSIVQAESADAAAQIFVGMMPHFEMPGSYVEVMPLADMSKM